MNTPAKHPESNPFGLWQKNALAIVFVLGLQTTLSDRSVFPQLAQAAEPLDELPIAPRKEVPLEILKQRIDEKVKEAQAKCGFCKSCSKCSQIFDLSFEVVVRRLAKEEAEKKKHTENLKAGIKSHRKALGESLEGK